MLWEYDGKPQTASVYRNGKYVTGELEFSKCKEPLILSGVGGFRLFDSELIEVGGEIFKYKSDNEEPYQKGVTFIEEEIKTIKDASLKEARGNVISLVKPGTEKVVFTGILTFDSGKWYLLNDETRYKKYIEEDDKSLLFYYKSYLDFLKAMEQLEE